MSHEHGPYDKGDHDSGPKKHLDVIQRVTGHRPPTCPWRSLYHPLVQEVLSVMPLDENGNLALALGADPPGIVVDAIAAYKLALNATRAEVQAQRAKQRAAEREARR